MLGGLTMWGREEVLLTVDVHIAAIYLSLLSPGAIKVRFDSEVAVKFLQAHLVFVWGGGI